MDWPFRGRQEELARVVALVESGVRLVTVTGTAGVGKTALAFEAFTALGGDEPAVVRWGPEEVPVVPSPTPQAATAAHLVLLDVAPGLRPDGAVIGEWLARDPLLHVIAASRSLIGLPAERPVTLEPFAAPSGYGAGESADAWLARNPSAAMFVDRVSAVSRVFVPERGSLEFVARICSELEGLPLAIHIAALQSSLLPLPAMLEELRFPLDFLSVGFAESADPAESVRAAIAAGMARLAREEIELLRAIARHPSGCSLRTLRSQDLPGLGKWGVNPMPLLSALVNAGVLVVRTIGRGPLTWFDLPPFHRAFFSEPHMADANEELLASLRKATIAQCREASVFRGPAWDYSADLFDAEHDNLVRFLEEDRDAGRLDDAANIVDLLTRYWVHRGRHEEALGYIDSVRERGDLSDESDARLATASAILKAQLTSYTTAYPLFMDAVASWRRTGQRDRLAEALVAFAPAAFEVDGWDEARAALIEAIAIFRELGDGWSGARAQAQLGALAADVPGQADFARITLNDASAALQGFGDLGYATVPLAHLGRLLLDEGEYEQACLVLDRGLAEIRAIGDRFHESAYLNLLGLGELSMGNPAKATHYLLESLSVTVQLGLKGRAVWCLEELCDALVALNAPEEAKICAAYAVELREQLDLRTWVESCSPARSARPMPELSRAVSMAITGAAAWPPTAVLTVVSRVLTELAVRASQAETLPRADAPDGLTAREREVLALLAEGMTSRAIANHLVISIDTVGRHITNLYRKIGARGRADATAYALKNGIHVGPALMARSLGEPATALRH